MRESYKQLTKRQLLLLGAFLVLASCSNDDEDHLDSVMRVERILVSSYNMGLALNFVPYTQERVEANKLLVSDHSADVICFQEVWLEEHVAAISEVIAGIYPHTYKVEPEQVFSTEAACATDEIQPLVDCANSLCEALSGQDLVACVPDQCGAFLTALPPSCFDGVVGGVGTPNITVQILVDQVTQPAGLFTFGGALGLMIASKHELKNTEFQDFIDDSSVNHRGALYAEIELNGDTHVIGCTHPTANLSASIDYPASGKHGSWEGENKFQQQQMIAFTNNKANSNPIYFAGDFNCGLANEANGVEGEFEENCQLWLDDGFVDPGAEQLNCTFCSEENLILNEQQVSGGSGGEGNVFIDHVFVKNAGDAAAMTAQRIFDDPITIEALDPQQELSAEDSPLTTHPSDHFGVQVEIPL